MVSAAEKVNTPQNYIMFSKEYFTQSPHSAEMMLKNKVKHKVSPQVRTNAVHR